MRRYATADGIYLPLPGIRRRQALLLLAALSLPFVLNDLLFMAVAGQPVLWLLIDYATKAGVLAAILRYPPFRRRARAALALQTRWWTALSLIVMTTLAIVILDPVLRIVGQAVLPLPALAGYPGLGKGLLYLFDMSAGLALTAVTEELVSRLLLVALLAGLGLPPVLIWIFAAALFAAFHWSLGGGALVPAFVAGLILMALYRLSGSILPPIAAHYFVNVVFFA